MRKAIFWITGAMGLVLAGFLGWNAEATTLSGSVTTHPGTSHVLVLKAGCWLPGLPGECELAQRKVCDRHGHCKCVPCSGWYPWRTYQPAR
jgi:hypothetical protein